MSAFSGQAAVVTGASAGIGRALTLGLAAGGASLCIVGRDEKRLEEVAAAARGGSPKVVTCRVDLAGEGASTAIAECVGRELGRLDLLLHAAGIIRYGTMRESTLADLDRHLAVNTRAPYALTRALLEELCDAKGQVVFVNSSVVFRGGAQVGQYGASKHALLAVADSLRAEVNPLGVRILSVFAGRTATPMQERIHEIEGKEYRPGRLLQPEDIASVVLHALSLPRTAEVTEIRIRPMLKS